MAFQLPQNKFVAFLDETGDHGMENIDPTYPVFAICCQATRTEDYQKVSLPNLTKMKLDVFKREDIILHGAKIRQRKPPFDCLKDKEVCDKFLAGISDCFKQMDGRLVASAIHKPKHKEKYADPGNPFFLSLQFVLERLHMHYGTAVNENNKLHCVFESRGKAEDKITGGWFDDICNGRNYSESIFHFSREFQPKSENIAGHQYADLAAYTIARYVETEDETRKDWVAIKEKMRKAWWGKIIGYGLKIFP
jgi:hypothetical protein